MRHVLHRRARRSRPGDVAIVVVVREASALRCVSCYKVAVLDPFREMCAECCEVYA